MNAIHPEGTSSSVTVCERDGVATGLRCANCRVPICPECLKRTEVGLKCASCAAPVARAAGSAAGSGRRRLALAVAAVTAVLAVGGVAVWTVPTTGGDATDNGQTPADVDTARTGRSLVAQGRFANGRAWMIEGSGTDPGAICSRIRFASVYSSETCDTVSERRPLGTIRTISRREPNPSHVTWGAVTPRAAVVRFIAEDGTVVSEVRTEGDAAVWGARFFATDVSRYQTITILVVAEGGDVLVRTVLQPPQPITP